MTRYWCVNFKNEARLEHAIQNQRWMMQYQYEDDHGNVFQGGNKKPATTSNWKQIGKISEGDKFAAYLPTSRFFAVGTVITPRRARTPNDRTDTISAYLQRRRSHDVKTGYVYYTPVFYENFSDKWRTPDTRMPFPQRIDVDEWQFYVPGGVVVSGLNAIKVFEKTKAAFEIPEELFQRVVNKLGGNVSALQHQTKLVPRISDIDVSPSRKSGIVTDSEIRKFLEDHASPTPKASDIGKVKPERAATTTYRILRDTALARSVKQMHKYECQVCGHTIVLANGSRYAEAHHIRPLGSPHDGPDVLANILCLCPNHHAECDLGVSKLSFAALRHFKGHEVAEEFITYHNRQIYGATTSL